MLKASTHQILALQCICTTDRIIKTERETRKITIPNKIHWPQAEFFLAQIWNGFNHLFQSKIVWHAVA